MSDSVTPWTAALQTSLSFTISQSWLKLMSMSIEAVMPPNHLILCCPLILLPPIFPSIRVFSSELALRIRRPKYWNFIFSISPSNEYSSWFPWGLTGCISLHSKGLSRVFSNTTLQKHQFFSAQPSLRPTPTSIHDYWKNHSLDYMDICWQSNGSAFQYVIKELLPRGKHLLISWLQ